jgi:hypothetical protein
MAEIRSVTLRMTKGGTTAASTKYCTSGLTAMVAWRRR